MPKVKKIELSFACDEDWNKMTPVEQGRHCISCQKTVVDFSSLSDAQLIAFYSKKENEKTCGQFRNGQLEHINKNLMLPERKSKTSFFKPLLATALLSTAACSDHTTRGEPEVHLENRVDEGNQSDSTQTSYQTNPKQKQKQKDFKPRKITHIETLSPKDTLPEKIQAIEQVVISERSILIRAEDLKHHDHTGGVPMITYRDDIITDIKVVPGVVRPPLHKRIGAKIRGTFNRNE